MLNTIVWREFEPSTAVVARSWIAREWHAFRLGLPFHRVRTAPFTTEVPDWAAPIYARELEACITGI